MWYRPYISVDRKYRFRGEVDLTIILAVSKYNRCRCGNVQNKRCLVSKSILSMQNAPSHCDSAGNDTSSHKAGNELKLDKIPKARREVPRPCLPY
jgi:hypothetical protein